MKTLQEARTSPNYEAGLLFSVEAPYPAEIVIPEGFPLTKCYRLDPNRENSTDANAANVHLLAALGKFKDPFVPVSESQCEGRPAWARLPSITKVEVTVGKKVREARVWFGTLTCVESITITAHASDGRVFTSPVCMAVPQGNLEKYADRVIGLYVTPEARKRVYVHDIWYHLGGCRDEGGPFDTQEEEVERNLSRFWAHMDGPDEPLRLDVLAGLKSIKRPWQSVIISSDGVVTIRHRDGPHKIIRPPARPTSATR